MEQIMELFELFLENFEIETSVHIRKNNKTIQLIDQRLLHDSTTGNTHVLFKTANDTEYTKVNIDRLKDFMVNELTEAIPGKSTDKLDFILNFFKSIPSTNKEKSTNTIPDIVKEITTSSDDPVIIVKKLLACEEGKNFLQKQAQIRGYSNGIQTLTNLLESEFGQTLIRKNASKFM